MKITKFKPRGRRYRTLNFRDLHSGRVEVDSVGRILLRGEEAGPVLTESRFHFFESELAPEEWERVRTHYGLPKKMRHICYSHGVRRGEGVQVGLGRYPKYPIHQILEDRDCASGEASYRADVAKAERLALEDLKAGPTKSDWQPQNDDEIPF